MAISLKGSDKNKIESELITKLKNQPVARAGSESTKSAEIVLQGLTAANDRPEISTRNSFKPNIKHKHGRDIKGPTRGIDGKELTKSERVFIKPRHVDPTAQHLFDGASLNTFSMFVKTPLVRSILDFKFERQFQSIQLPTNSFEEHIILTQEGKMWHYPIDNEQGKGSETTVPFYEHVFLEELLNNGFPKKGPIRHFMELVCIGLSANPYMTVQQKHEHIAWYREYFKQHESLIKETIADK